jgi:hypothetical protein
MSNLVKFGSYDVEAAHEEKSDLSAGGGQAEFMKLKAGRNVVRIIPPPMGKRSPFRTVYQHFIQTPTGPIVFVCPRLEKKQPCPACQRAEEFRGSKNEEDQKMASEFFARRRVFCNVVDRGEPEKGAKVLAFGKGIHESLVALRDDPDSGGDYTHPINGFDIIIERSGNGKNDTKYAVRGARNTSQLADDVTVMQSLIDTQRDLEQFARVPTWDELRDMLAGKKREKGDGASQQRQALPATQPEVINARPRRGIADDTLSEDY